jgi:hypothetical protein
VASGKKSVHSVAFFSVAVKKRAAKAALNSVHHAD